MRVVATHDHLELAEELADNLRISTEGRTVKAREVPVGGAFDYQGEMFIRSSGKGRVTDKKFTTLTRPCVGVSLETGDIVGLDEAKVTYFPNAQLVS